MSAIEDIFSRRGVAIGMVHARALPGTPRWAGDLDAIVRTAGDEARILADAGFDGVLIENMHDGPYLVGEAIGPEIVACMTRIGLAVRESAPDLPLGVQVLAAGNRQAVAVARAIGASFVRIENFAYAHVADEGLMPGASAGELLRYRRAIGADSVRIFADIKKKHASHAITGDLSIGEMARGAAFCGADAVVVTGGSTGEPAREEDLREAATGGRSVLVGSGVTASNAGAMLAAADGVIVGSALKVGGRWDGEVDRSACEGIMRAIGEARS